MFEQSENLILKNDQKFSEDLPLEHHRRSFTSAIVGYWIEEKNSRKNFDSFLSQLNSDIDANDFIYSKDWEEEKVIYLDDNKLTIDEVRPNGKIFRLEVLLNNETLSKTDIKLHESLTYTIADVSNNSINLYVLRPNSTAEVFLTISYKFVSDDTNTLIVKFKHIESNASCSFLFHRQ